MTKQFSLKWPIIGGLLAAAGASICCAGPLVLLMLGISGSWISTLTAFDAFRPYFIIIVVGLLSWAGWQVHRPIDRCPEGDVCAIPEKRKQYQTIYWTVVSVAMILVSSPYWILRFV
ncbi:MAG: mercuric transporter MerT family protein [Gammaproteobacteria bacterium]|nr:mercuric transporter MerT family protein [Gammaproteobacteria bacterium]